MPDPPMIPSTAFVMSAPSLRSWPAIRHQRITHSSLSELCQLYGGFGTGMRIWNQAQRALIGKADSASGYIMPQRVTRMKRACMILCLQLDHIEVALGGGESRTNPDVQNVADPQ